MKKRICFLSSFLVAMTLLINLMPVTDAKAEVSKEGWPKVFVTTGMKLGAGGTVFMSALTKETREKLGVSGQVREAAGPVQQVIDLAKGGSMVASGNTQVASDAWSGEGGFATHGRLTNIRGLLLLYPGAMHWMTRPTGIKTVRDWKGRKIQYLMPGVRFRELIVDALLEFNGMTRGDIVALPLESAREGAENLKHGLVDVICWPGSPAGHPSIKKLASETALYFITFTDAEVKFVTDKLSWSSPVSYPAGSYKGQGHDVQEPGYLFGAYISAELPASFVYQLCKIMFDDVGKDTSGHFTQYHKSFTWNLNFQMENPIVIPWHEGCVQYFKDRGVWTPKMESRQKKLLAGMR